MALHPVGPLPASTYWRRRAVIVVVVVVLLVLLKSCTGGGSSTPTAATRPQTTSSPTPTPTPTVTVTVTPTSRPSATVSPAPVGTLCTDAQLSLTGSTDEPSYPVGTEPTFTLVVKNTSATACTRDLGTGAVELLVYSGDVRQWSSDDCNTAHGTSLTRLAPGATQAIVLHWNGLRSKVGCTGPKAQAGAGTYRLLGRIGTLKGQVAVFRFT